MIDRYVEQAFPGVYFNPDRWDTADGFLPFPVFDLYADALWRQRAVERVNLLTAIKLAFADQKVGGSLVNQSLTEGFPAEVTHGA